MTQSMSRVAHCIDNGPMEGFWGILKRERYYGRRFTSKRELIQTIENYIHYYNTRRVQRNLGVLTPMEKHKSNVRPTMRSCIWSVGSAISAATSGARLSTISAVPSSLRPRMTKRASISTWPMRYSSSDIRTSIIPDADDDRD